MLVAAGVLFYVSYWLISRFEAKRWTDFLAQRARQRRRAGRAGHAGAHGVFGCVSRRGRDVAVVSSPAGKRGADAAGPSGLGGRPGARGGRSGGDRSLVKATSVRLPIQLFFKLSGLFLFVLAIVFAGNGVFELQNAGVLVTTNLAWMGRGLPWAGLFPNLQVLSVQGLLFFGAVAAWLVVPRSALGVGTGNSAGHQARGEAQLISAGSLGMSQRWIGPSVVAVILAGVAVVLALNLNWKGRGGARKASVTEPEPVSGSPGGGDRRPPAGFREYPIGEDVEKNQIRIAAVYLPPVEMEGMPGAGSLVADPPRG